MSNTKFPEEDPDIEQEALQRALGIIGEFFHSYSLVVLDSDGILNYYSSSYYEGKMLCSEAIAEMNKDNINEEEEEEDEEEE